MAEQRVREEQVEEEKCKARPGEGVARGSCQSNCQPASNDSKQLPSTSPALCQARAKCVIGTLPPGLPELGSSLPVLHSWGLGLAIKPLSMATDS